MEEVDFFEFWRDKSFDGSGDGCGSGEAEVEAALRSRSSNRFFSFFPGWY